MEEIQIELIDEIHYYYFLNKVVVRRSNYRCNPVCIYTSHYEPEIVEEWERIFNIGKYALYFRTGIKAKKI